MRYALLLLLAMALGCAGATAPKTPKSNPIAEVVRVYPAARWIPAKPTYAFAARTVRDAQEGIRALIDTAGIAAGLEAALASAALEHYLGVDALSPDALAAIGVDVEGGLAMFSEAINPTVVVHLRDPRAMHAFLARTRAVRTKLDGDDVYTAELDALGARLSWVISADWMWIHLHGGHLPEDGPGWYAGTKRPGAPAWANDWMWAQRTSADASPSFLGFVDLRPLVASAALFIPKAGPCLDRFTSVGSFAVALDRESLRLAVDIGGAATGVRSAILPPPDGWAAASDQAAVSAQLNVDVPAALAWAEPCLAFTGRDLSWIPSLGVRAARAIIHKIDPSRLSGSGAVSADLSSPQLVQRYLDKIPFRKRFESARRFGPHDGVTLSIPITGPKVDYVLTDTMFLAGLGDGLLARAAGRGPGATNALLAVDISPPALGAGAIELLLDQVGVPEARRIASLLLRYRHGRAAVLLDGTRLVLELRGNRR